MDVALAAHGDRVAQIIGDLLDGARDVALGRRLGVEALELAQRQEASTVPAQVRKSLAVNGSPLISWR